MIKVILLFMRILSFKLILLIVILLETGCSTPIMHFESKPDLIKNYSYSLQNKEPFKAPYISMFEKGKKKLWFAAIQHSSDSESSSFKTIHEAFTRFKPEVVIIEGVEDTGELSPENFTQYVMKMADQKSKWSSEAAYSAWLALQRHIPYAPSEPTNLSIAESFEKSGRTKEDYLYFEVARILPQWKMQGKVKNWSEYTTEAKKFGIYAFKQVGIKKHFDFKEFLDWFHSKMGKVLKYNSLTPEDFSPQLEMNPTELNRLSNEADSQRERHINEVTVKMLNQYNRVMIVFGSGHLVKHRAVLTDLLGKSHDEKWFDSK